MAYTPKTWVCGETITDAGLNNIEEGIQEALAGGGSSLPEVTSADDGKVLTVVDGEWDKADKDFKCSSDTIFNGSVTTSGNSTHTASFTLAKAIVADSVVVTFNGTEYECKVREEQGTGSTILQVMGGNSTESFPRYPFRISVVKNATSATIYTAANGTYTLNISKVSAETSDCFETAVKSVVEVGYNCVGDDVETSECFEKAVKSVVDAGYECKEGEVSLLKQTVSGHGDYNSDTLEYDKQIDVDSLIVYFDSTRYECPKINVSTGQRTYNGYGGIDASGNTDFSTYPFAITSQATGLNEILLSSGGEHEVELKVVGEVITTTPCFEKAVKKLVDKGYECKETYSPLLEESVTTVEDQWGGNAAELTYSNHIDAPKIRVVVNGVEYDCEEISHGSDSYYGGMTESLDVDFSKYPFFIVSMYNAGTSSYDNSIVTETAGTYNVKIETATLTAETSECFCKAVNNATSLNGTLTLGNTTLTEAQLQQLLALI